MNGIVPGTMSIPSQNTFDLPLDDIFFFDKELSFVLKPERAPKIAWAHYSFPNAEKSLKEKGFLEGTLMQMTNRGMDELKRPQTPMAPFEYEQRNVVIENPNDGAKLSGTLTYPTDEETFLVAVLITVSR